MMDKSKGSHHGKETGGSGDMQPFILPNQYIGYSDHLALRLDTIQEILGVPVAPDRSHCRRSGTLGTEPSRKLAERKRH